MNLIMMIILSFLMTQAISTHADAQTYQITSVQVVGAGCPQGSVSAVLANDLSAISILFDRFMVTANKGTISAATPSLRKSCKFIFGVQVSEGYNLEATTLQYRGFAQLPGAGITANITTSGSIMNQTRFVLNKNMITSSISNKVDNFFIEQSIFQDFKNTCQRQTKIEFETSISLIGRSNRFTMIFPEQSALTIDSLDAGPSSSAIELGIKLSPCH